MNKAAKDRIAAMGPDMAKLLMEMHRYEQTPGSPRIGLYNLPDAPVHVTVKSWREGMIRKDENRGRLTPWGRELATVLLADLEA